MLKITSLSLTTRSALRRATAMSAGGGEDGLHSSRLPSVATARALHSTRTDPADMKTGLPSYTPPPPYTVAGTAMSPYRSMKRAKSASASALFSNSGDRRFLNTATQASNSDGQGRYIRIIEVSPRDGLQNLPPPAVPTSVKKELVERLLAAGVRNIEVGSFVRPDWVPQMADSAALLPLLPSPSTIDAPTPRPLRSASPLSGIPVAHKTAQLPPHAEEVHFPVLVPNMRGLDNLLKLEEEHAQKGRKEKLTDEIAVFVSATEAFSQANNHASVAKVLSGLPAVIAKAKEHGYRVRGYVSCVMTCPYSGPTPPEQVVDVTRQLLGMGCYEVSLGDTTGEGNPDGWRRLWETSQKSGLDMTKIAAHCHDTFSMALSSIISLLPYGLPTVDSSLAGLGGCPYSPGATGNVPTEDVVYALHKLGYETGIDLDKLVEAGNWLSETLGVRNESRAGRAIWARRLAREQKEQQDAQL